MPCLLTATHSSNPPARARSVDREGFRPGVLRTELPDNRARIHRLPLRMVDRRPTSPGAQENRYVSAACTHNRGDSQEARIQNAEGVEAMTTDETSLRAELARLGDEATRITARWDETSPGPYRDDLLVKWLGVGQARDQVRAQLASLTGDWT